MTCSEFIASFRCTISMIEATEPCIHQATGNRGGGGEERRGEARRGEEKDEMGWDGVGYIREIVPTIMSITN